VTQAHVKNSDVSEVTLQDCHELKMGRQKEFRKEVKKYKGDGSEVLTAVSMKSFVLWDVGLYGVTSQKALKHRKLLAEHIKAKILLHRFPVLQK
jgi:hypothetical protein